MLKKYFHLMFKRSQDKAFIEENIQNAFKKSGIWPVDGTTVIAKVKRPPLSPLKVITDPNFVPLIVQEIRKFKLDYKRDPTNQKIEIIFNS